MTITITKPTAKVEVITDVNALRELIEAFNVLNQLQEANKPAKIVQAQKTKTRKIMKQVDVSTLILVLHGLNSSAWNLLVVKHSSAKGNVVVKDWPALIMDAIPGMLDGVRWKLPHEGVQDVDLTNDELHELLESLTDSQTQELMIQIQTLNTPVASVPKELRDRL